jgi:hypothetical protein
MNRFVILIGLTLMSFEIFAQIDSSDLFVAGQIRVMYKNHKVIPSPCKIEIGPLQKFEKSDSLGNFKFDKLKRGNYYLSIYGQPRLIRITNILLDSLSRNDIEIVIEAENDWASREIAEIDIELNEIKLLIVGGIAPIFYSSQYEFEKKYQIKYYDYGDLIRVPFELMEEYNKRVFEYLDFKYGQKWRLEVRKDVLGL